MRLLALETTTLTGTVAAFDTGRLLTQRPLDPQKRSAQSLAPGIHQLLDEVGWKPRDIELIAVAVGPGSFTGLRVGVTCAKTLAYATRADVIGVNTLAAIAHRGLTYQTEPQSTQTLWAIIDAHRRQVFAARFERRSAAALHDAIPTRAIDDNEWLAMLHAGDHVTGPGLAKFQTRLPAGVATLPSELWAPTAESVGHLAITDHAAGRRDNLWALTPQYYRQSAAEERLR